jgi:hypothetical protein
MGARTSGLYVVELPHRDPAQGARLVVWTCPALRADQQWTLNPGSEPYPPVSPERPASRLLPWSREAGTSGF